MLALRAAASRAHSNGTVVELLGDDRHVLELLARDRLAVDVALASAFLDDALAQHPRDEAAEAALVLDEAVADVERDPAGRADEVERLGEREAICRVDPAVRMRRDVQLRHFNLLDQTRALENQVVWVSSNQVGRFGRLRSPGQSKVVDPSGRVLARTGARAGAAVARVDAPGIVAAARERLSYVDDRRPQAYSDERAYA